MTAEWVKCANPFLASANLLLFGKLIEPHKASFLFAFNSETKQTTLNYQGKEGYLYLIAIHIECVSH